MKIKNPKRPGKRCDGPESADLNISEAKVSALPKLFVTD